MRILTIRPPWAQAIFHGKDVENRTWSTDYRGPVAVHAGVRFDTGAWDHGPLAAWVSGYWGITRENFTGDMLRGGAIIGVVDLVDVHQGHNTERDRFRAVRSCYQVGKPFGPCSPWAEPDAYHLVLANPRPLAEPIPYRGALGLRRLDADTVALIEAGL